MTKGRDDAVSTRAYQIWEAEGRPEGRGEAHWRQAEQDIYAGDDAVGARPGAGDGAGAEATPQTSPDAPKSAGAGI